MTWETVPLGEIARVDAVQVAPGSVEAGSTYVGLEHISAGGVIDETFLAADAGLKSSKNRFTSRHILYGKLRPNLGKVARPRTVGVCSTDIYPLLPGPEVDRDYLAQYFLSPQAIGYASSRTAGVNLPRVSWSALGSLPIPLPPLTEQRRIAAILDEADATVLRANAALTLVADAEDALFESTLGRSIRGTSRTLGDYSLEFRYGTSQKSGPSGTPVLRIPNLNGRTVDLNDLKTVDLGAAERERLSLGDKDVLFVRSNGNPAVVGRAGAFASVPTDRRNGTMWVFASYLIRARLVAGVSTRGVVALTRSPIARRHLRAAAATSAGQFNISIPVLRSLPMFEPFGVQQEEFDNGMDELETLRSASSRREDSSQELFASLQHRAFRGEL